MAGKLIELDEAAKMIGVSPDELTEMRSRGQIAGVRTGANWKFKQEEVERVIQERAGGTGGELSLGDDLQLQDSGAFSFDVSPSPAPAESQESLDSILITDEVVGRPDGSTKQSTIIGKQGTGGEGLDSDITLAPEPVEGGTAAGSGLSLADSVHSGSDLKLTGSGTNPLVEAATGSVVAAEGGSDLQLGEEDDGEITLGSDKGPGGPGSDITLGAGDSGINLSPTDSGLSLEEEPLDLGGSAVDSLELPEDDDVISLEDEAADPDQATQLKADDQFLLSPADSLMEDESDSGSQVIALEDSEAFDQDAATMLGAGEPALLTEDAFAAMPADALAAEPVGTTAMAMPGMAGAVQQPVYVQVPVQEAPYSVWNVLGLLLTTALLTLAGMLITDVVLNMWTFQGSGGLSSGVADAVLSMVPGSK